MGDARLERDDQREKSMEKGKSRKRRKNVARVRDWGELARKR